MLSFCSIEFTGLLVKGMSLFIFCWQNPFLIFYYENFQSHKCRENSSMSLHIYTVIDYWFFKTWRHFGIILTLQSTNSMWIQIFFSPHIVSFFIYLYDLCLQVYFVCCEYCYLQFIVISVCKKYLFPPPFFNLYVPFSLKASFVGSIL